MSSEPAGSTLGATYQRPRPGNAWWIGGALLVVAGVLVGVGLVVSVFVTMFRTEGQLQSDGRPVGLSLEADHEYLLWTGADHLPLCFVVDKKEGGLLPLHGMGSSGLSKDGQEAFAWFSAGSGEVAVSCEAALGPGTEVVDDIEVGPRPGAPEWIGGIVGSIVVPLLLVLAGIAVLVITGVRAVAARRP